MLLATLIQRPRRIPTFIFDVYCFLEKLNLSQPILPSLIFYFDSKLNDTIRVLSRIPSPPLSSAHFLKGAVTKVDRLESSPIDSLSYPRNSPSSLYVFI